MKKRIRFRLHIIFGKVFRNRNEMRDACVLLAPHKIGVGRIHHIYPVARRAAAVLRRLA
jgi:hypothetical protein